MSLTKNRTAEKKFSKVIIIGIDGMDPRMANSLMESGELPNFKRLASKGSFTELATSYPPASPVAWTSIATGTNPGKHGIFDFILVDRKTYLPEISLSKPTAGIAGTRYGTFVKRPGFWSIASSAGVPVTLLRWPVTFPPEDINGDLLSGLGVPDIRGFLSGYTYFTEGDVLNAERDMKVDIVGNEIDTELPGPNAAGVKGTRRITTPLHIKLGEDGRSAEISINDKNYVLKAGEWSEWLSAEFKIGVFKTVTGTFKAMLLDTEAFGLYVTSIQIDPKNPVVAISSPAEYSNGLAEEIGRYYTLGMPEETGGYVDGRIGFDDIISQIEEIESERDRMLWTEFEQFKKSSGGIFAIVYDSSDRLQHISWEETISGATRTPDLSEDIIAYYKKKDALLGRILDQIGDETLLLVVSDHGFSRFDRAVNVNTWLYENGYLALTKKPSADDDGALYKYVDWKKTKAYSVGFNSININIVGREKEGIVEDKDKGALMAEIMSGLGDLTDDKTGLHPVHKVYRREDIYSGDNLADAPDMIIGFNPGFRMESQNAIGGFKTEVITDNDKGWIADHMIDPLFVPGVLFSSSILKPGQASQIDIAPTILSALGIQPTEEMDGSDLLG